MAMTVCDCKGTYYRGFDCSKSLCFNDFENDEAGNCSCPDGFSGNYCEVSDLFFGTFSYLFTTKTTKKGNKNKSKWFLFLT